MATIYFVMIMTSIIKLILLIIWQCPIKSNELNTPIVSNLKLFGFFWYIVVTTFLHININVQMHSKQVGFPSMGVVVSIPVSFFSFLCFFARMFFSLSCQFPFFVVSFFCPRYIFLKKELWVKNYGSSRLNKKSKSWIWLAGKIKYEKKIATNS
jgi:hypothetical protein